MNMKPAGKDFSASRCDTLKKKSTKRKQLFQASSESRWRSEELNLFRQFREGNATHWPYRRLTWMLLRGRLFPLGLPALYTACVAHEPGEGCAFATKWLPLGAQEMNGGAQWQSSIFGNNVGNQLYHFCPQDCISDVWPSHNGRSSFVRFCSGLFFTILRGGSVSLPMAGSVSFPALRPSR